MWHMVSHYAIKNKGDVKRIKAIGFLGEREAISTLRILGFKEITKSEKINSVYDMEATSPLGNKCLVEVKTRSPAAKTQFFTIRDTKIKNIEKVMERKGVKECYIFCINKYGYRLLTLDQVKDSQERPPDVRVYRYRKAKSTVRGYKPSEKTRTLRIRCGRETLINFKRVATGYRSYEDLIKAMLSVYEGYPDLFRKPQFR